MFKSKCLDLLLETLYGVANSTQIFGVLLNAA